MSATLPQLLRRNAETMAERPALREKDRGIWQTWSWADYWSHVRGFAAGLAALGFKRGDKLSVIGDNRPRLYAAQLAAQALGGISVPVYQDSIASELAFVLGHAEVAVIVAEDQEQVDKIMSIADKLPSLTLLIYDDPRGMWDYEIPMLRAFDEVVAIGGRTDIDVDAAVTRGTGDDLAMIAYTSGTTGAPKGAMLTHGNLIAVGHSFALATGMQRDDEWLSYLPMAWVGDVLYSTVLSLIVGFACNCPEGPETLPRDLRELGPTAMLAPPRIWEGMVARLQVRANDASTLKRHTFSFFRRLAEAAELKRSAGRFLSPLTRLGLAIGEFLVYGPVRDQLGLGRTRWAYTGGAPLGPDAYRFFRSFGINLKQIYGATELTGLAALQPDGEADPNTVGRICSGMEARIAGNEVQIRSPGLFQGYYKDDAATEGALAGEGWFRTGDAGFLDLRGHLVIIDRAKDVGALQDGSAFAPQFIENKLKFSPFIGEAVAFGHERPFVAAIIAIDMGSVGNWAERRNVAYTSFQDLSGKAEVHQLIAAEIARCNATLPDGTRIRRFLLLNKEFDADDSEITRTRKIRRRFVAERYQRVIDAFYRGDASVDLATEVTFEDGRRTIIEATLDVHDVAVPAAAARELIDA